MYGLTVGNEWLPFYIKPAHLSSLCPAVIASASLCERAKQSKGIVLCKQAAGLHDCFVASLLAMTAPPVSPRLSQQRASIISRHLAQEEPGTKILFGFYNASGFHCFFHLPWIIFAMRLS
jgi:hypothetical protein